MDTKTTNVAFQASSDIATLSDEWAKLIQQASEQHPDLVERIKDCRKYCSNISAFVTEICVTENR